MWVGILRICITSSAFRVLQSGFWILDAWDYGCVSREHYLSLPKEEKEVMLCKYYTDMKARSSSKNFICFFVWSDMLENIFVRRDYLKNKVLTVENDVLTRINTCGTILTCITGPSYSLMALRKTKVKLHTLYIQT